MIPLLGPFVPDPNVTSLALAHDDRVWIVRRRAVHDESAGATHGVIVFEDVLAYRVRAREGGAVPDTREELAAGWWALVLSQSTYLDEVRAAYATRPADALTTHAHFVVPDGNNRAFDVVARAAAVRSVDGPLGVDLTRVFRDDDPQILT